MRNLLVKISPVVGRVTAHAAQSVPNLACEAAGLTKVAVSACSDEIKRIKEARKKVAEFYAQQATEQANSSSKSLNSPPKEEIERAVTRVQQAEPPIPSSITGFLGQEPRPFMCPNPDFQEVGI